MMSAQPQIRRNLVQPQTFTPVRPPIAPVGFQRPNPDQPRTGITTKAGTSFPTVAPRVLPKPIAIPLGGGIVFQAPTVTIKPPALVPIPAKGLPRPETLEKPEGKALVLSAEIGIADWLMWGAILVGLVFAWPFLKRLF